MNPSTTSLRRGNHELIVAAYPDALIEAVIADLGQRNLKDQRDHEVRWAAERCSAARHERQARKAAGTWSIVKPGKQATP